MSVKAIVYESETGHTKRYAEMLGEKIDLPVYTIKDAKTGLEKDSSIIYMSWIAGRKLVKFSKVKMYNTAAICAVGMSPPDHSGEILDEISKSCGIERKNIFYMQGGISINKLHGIYRIMMNAMLSAVEKASEKDSKATVNQEMASMLKGEKDFVDAKNLFGIVSWFKKQKEADKACTLKEYDQA